MANYLVLATPRSFAKNDDAPIRLLEENGCEVVRLPKDGGDLTAQLAEYLPQADAVIAGLEPYDRALLSTAKKLKVISRYGVGYDKVDLDAARELGIKVSITPGANGDSVADLAMALMLNAARHVCHMDAVIRAGGHDKPVTGVEMWKKTLGVVGTGRIGKAVIHNLSGFGCRIIAHDPYPSEEMKQMGVEYVSLDSLYAQSDVITLHTFLNDSTYHMINTEAIQQMKPGVVIINCARGALIDTRALIDGIESGRVGSVGVDCFEGEDDVIRVDHSYNSHVTNHDYIILKSFQNTIVTPHVAFFTDQAVFDMVQCSLESLHQFDAGENVPLEVHA